MQDTRVRANGGPKIYALFPNVLAFPGVLINSFLTFKIKITMKKMFLMLVALVAFSVVYAQPGGGFQRRTVEERVAMVHAKMDSAFKLSATKAAEVDAIFTTFYKDSDKAREELMATGERPSREAMQAKMQPLTEAREKKLKEALPEAQYEIWKKEIEPGMRPQRPGGGGK